MKLLIVDDQKEQYVHFIRDTQNHAPDIQIEIVPSAIEGMAEFKRRQPDLIILDQKMGGGEKDGTAFLRKLNECCSSTKIPEIIFVTQDYNELPTTEILIIDIPITLFLEKDSSFPDTLLVATQLVMRRMDSRVRYDPKDLFGDLFIELILNESSEIIKKEHAGYYS